MCSGGRTQRPQKPISFSHKEKWSVIEHVRVNDGLIVFRGLLAILKVGLQVRLTSE